MLGEWTVTVTLTDDDKETGFPRSYAFIISSYVSGQDEIEKSDGKN